MKKMVCMECGTELAKNQRFCSTKCRKDFNNRRAMRGAQLYDMFMASRFERDVADEAKLRSVMARMASEWNRVDGGKKTWGDWKEFLANNPAMDPTKDIRPVGVMKIGRPLH